MGGAAIYGTYDQATLDRQYNAREAVPDHPAVIAAWDAAGAAVAARLARRADIPYAPGERRAVDVYPAGPGAPVLVFLHGGYWQWRDRKDFAFLAGPWVDAGVTVVMAGYPLAPGARMGEIVAACRLALVWTLTRIESHGGDPERIWVAGHSAGGHLAAAMLATDWRTMGFARAPVAGGLAISGLYDLEPIRLSYLNEAVRLTPEEAAACSPLRHPPAEAPPLLVTVGGDETAEFHRQQAALVAAWRGAGLAVEAIDLPGRNHFTALGALAEPEHALFRALHARLFARPGVARPGVARPGVAGRGAPR